jgi:fermentation-respiration switch protein FrsA (DUF1100 family)
LRISGALLLVVLSACAHRIDSSVPATVTSETFVTLHGHALRLHLSQPVHPPSPAPLLVYATGDAGWWGKDRAIFDELVGAGCDTVGFSAREYVHHLGKGMLHPVEIASDYEAIIAAALSALRMPPDTRAVLVGKSRGAGLAVGAAIDSQLNAVLAGVLAIGLTREEEYVHGSRSEELAMLQTYARLEDLGRLPVAVIQSTNDEYVPAAEARQLLGPDTAWRLLVPIDSRDHNFGGATDVLYTEMKRSLQWILHR